MTKRFFFISLLGTLLSMTVFASIIKDGTLRADPDGSYIKIRWESDNETGVAKYVLERKAGLNGSFMTLTELAPKGNGSSYQFVDETVFRVSQTIYKYQVKVVFSDGQAPIYYGPITAIPRTSDVRRTWGSIKAMFR
ncbi:MAG: hypothetical protein HY961_16665 [Ignavibacteriae bacterium]|nr:hypothetical protein [Ignavibacteriota bacterium]